MKASKHGVAATGLSHICSDAPVGDFVPLWRQVADDIRRRIDRGLLKPGDKLPTTKELADQYETSPGTVRKAVDILIATGVLRGHQGLGVFVPEATQPEDCGTEQ